MASHGSPPNPYDPYQSGAYPTGSYMPGGYPPGLPLPAPHDRRTKLPTFCTVMFIIDLVACGLRLIAVVLSVLGGIIYAAEDDPMAKTAILEIATGLGITLFGLLGNGLMLTKRPVGQYLAWLGVLFTVGSMGVGIWQLSIQLENPAPEMQAVPQETLIGVAAFILLLRVAYFGAYIAALLRFNRFVREMPQSATDDPAYWSQAH